MNKKYSIIIVASLILWTPVIIYVKFVNNDPFNIKEKLNTRRCEEEALVKNTDINGVVIEKFVDYRGSKLFKYVQDDDTLISNWLLLSDEFYSFIQVGDTIRKDKSSLQFHVNKSGKDNIHNIDFGCQPDLNSR